MSGQRIWAGALAVALAAILLAACGGGERDQAQVASQTNGSQESAEVEQEARVQVIRGRAMLGDPNAPVLIQEHSDFL